MGEPFGAGLGHLAGVRVGGIGGGAAAELVDPGGLDWLRVGVQAGELLAGVGGEGAGGGAVRYAEAARRCGGRHQVIADGLAQPGAQPGGQPGAGADGRQRLGESALLAAGAVAVPACLAPAQQYLAVPDEHVTRRGPRPFLDPRRGPAALRAATRGSAGGVGDHVRYRPAVPCHRHRRDQQPGNPQQRRRHRAGRRAACRRGLRGPGAAGSVHEGGSFCGFRFLGRNENCRGTAFPSPRLCNSQLYLWTCGQAAIIFRLPAARTGTECLPEFRAPDTAETGS